MKQIDLQVLVSSWGKCLCKPRRSNKWWSQVESSDPFSMLFQKHKKWSNMASSSFFFVNQGDPHIKVKHVEIPTQPEQKPEKNAMDLSDPERFLEEIFDMLFCLCFMDSKI